MDVRTLPTPKNNHLFVVNNYLYHVEKKAKDGVRHCRCIQKKAKGCSARAVICTAPDLNVRKTSGIHCHEPESDELIRRSVVQRMKCRIVDEPNKSAKQIHAEEISVAINEHQEAHSVERLGAALPGFASVNASLYRARAKVRPPLPSCRADINLEGSWTETTDGRSFLLFDDGLEDRILGFSTDDLISSLCGAATVYMDGTFHVTPHLFTQLYTIHAFYRGQMIPMVFFLLPGKTKEIYCRMFALLKSYAASIGKIFHPATFQVDFEVSTLKAIEEEFPSSAKKGCAFHFAQCLWRKIQEYGLVPYYDDKDIHRFLRSCGALSLVPLNALGDAWMEIQADAPSSGHPANEALEQFKMYFINTWLENPEIFPRHLWNHYGNFATRTTNHLEGWHQALNRGIGKAHVNIFEMIIHLRKLEENYRNTMFMLRMGHDPPRPNKKYMQLNRKLMRFVESYEQDRMSLLEYIHSVAYNVRF